MKINNKVLALLASYGRSILSAGLALYLAGVTDPKQLLWTLVSAVIPVLIRFLNPNDPAFGIAPTVAEVDVALATAKPRRKRPGSGGPTASTPQ